MCTLKNEHVPPNGNTRGYMYPQTEIWVGMLEVRGLYCELMVLTKINMVSSPYVQGLSNFQQYTCRHAELDEHKLMAWALKIILHDTVSLLFIV